MQFKLMAACKQNLIEILKCLIFLEALKMTIFSTELLFKEILTLVWFIFHTQPALEAVDLMQEGQHFNLLDLIILKRLRQLSLD